MSQCKISVVVPVYNVEKYLRTCLDSIINQTFKEFEVIIVNDGSTDNSASILKEYEEKYKDLIHVFTIKNQGVSHARNYGVTKAKGDYLLFVDSDDYLELEMLEVLYTKAAKDDNDVVICGYNDIYVNETTQEVRKKASKAFEIAIGRNFNIHETKFELVHISPFPWDKLYRRTLFEKHQFPEKIRFEDLSVMYNIMTDTNSIGVCEERLYNYRRGSSGSFLSSFSKGTLDLIEALNLFIRNMKAQGMYEEFSEEIEYICIRHILVRYDAIFDPKIKGMLDIKKEMILKCNELLENNFPDWKQNRYLKYTASQAAKNKAVRYRDVNHMLKVVCQKEKTPVWLAVMLHKTKTKLNNGKKKFNKFKKREHKFSSFMKNTPLFKLFHLPNDVIYTRYYEKYPVTKNDVLFESKHGDDIAGNIFSMLSVMQDEAFSQFHLKLTLKEGLMESMTQLLSGYGITDVEIILTDTKEYMKALATAEYLVTDTSFPTYFIKRKEQIYLNTWHGTPLKAMGRIVPQREYGLGNVQRNFFLADYLLYQNEFSRDIFVNDYMLAPLFHGKIMLSGYPRNSAFFNEDRYEQIRSEMSIEDKQVYVYMPTWRGTLNKKQDKKQTEQLLNYFYQLDSLLSDNQIVYVKLHPFVKASITYDNLKKIMPFPENYETYDFLNASDGLITDYSSIMFDYAVSKKKIVLFTYDREEYLKDRGLYFDINSVEFPIADTVEELVKALDQEIPYPKFFEKFCRYDNANTALNVCETMFLHQEPEFKLEPVKTDVTKENVLLLCDANRKEADWNRFIDRMNQTRLDNFQYFLTMKSSSIRKSTAVLSKLKKEIFYIPFMFDVNYTFKDRLACLKTFKFHLRSEKNEKLLNSLGARERVKYFGEAEFKTVVNLASMDQILFHMCASFPGTKIYVLDSFNYAKYETDKKYRIKLDYVISRFSYYDYIVCDPEITKLSIKPETLKKAKLITDLDLSMDLTMLIMEVQKR